MSKLLTLVATSVFCATTILHSAEEKPRPTYPGEKEAIESSRFGLESTRFAPGKQLPTLTTEAIERIQRYLLKHAVQPVEIVNTENKYTSTVLEIVLLDPTTGTVITRFPLYSTNSSGELLNYAIWVKHESRQQFYERYAKETGRFITRTIDLPVAHLTLVVIDNESKKVYGYLKLQPSEMKNLNKIELNTRDAKLCYKAEGVLIFGRCVSKDYQKIPASPAIDYAEIIRLTAQ